MQIINTILKNVEYKEYNNMSKLLECLKNMEKKTYKSSRKNALDYSIHAVNDENQNVVVLFSSGSRVDLSFKAFNTIIDYLVQNSNRFVRIGSTLEPSVDSDTLEDVIQKLDPDKKTHTKRAVHICDILCECRFVEYGSAVNPKTQHNNQAVKWKKVRNSRENNAR